VFEGEHVLDEGEAINGKDVVEEDARGGAEREDGVGGIKVVG
jgi:hypothetical protein